jgi:hypothetical protein
MIPAPVETVQNRACRPEYPQGKTVAAAPARTGGNGR